MLKTLKNNYIIFAVMALAICGVVALGVGRDASAQEATAAPASTSTVADAAPGSTFEQRLAQRKAEQSITLDEKDQKRLSSTCVNAQAKLRAQQSVASEAMTRRAKLYLQVDGRLWTIIGKLKLAGKDTYEFEKIREGLSDRVAAITVSGDNYKQTLDDLVVINCKSDLEGFKALLETARYYHTEIRSTSSEIKDYQLNTLKPALSTFGDELKGGAAKADAEASKD